MNNNHLNHLNNTNNNSQIHQQINLIKIIALNINSIIGKEKKLLLADFLQRQNPDIVLLTETKTNIKHKIYITNYQVIRNDRVNIGGGGTAILVKPTLKYDVVNIPPNLQKIECTIIRIHLTNNKFLNICAMYNSPENRAIKGQINIEEFETILRTMNYSKNNNYYVIGGDFNAKHETWFDQHRNTNGTILRNWLDLKADKFKARFLHSLDPTIPYHNSYVDFFLIHKNLEVLYKPNHNKQYINTVTTTFTDHAAIELNIDLNKQTDGNTIGIPIKDTTFKFNYKKANWTKFSNYITKTIKTTKNDPSKMGTRNLTTTEIDETIAEITTIINTAMDESIKKNTDQQHKNNRNPKCNKKPN